MSVSNNKAGFLPRSLLVFLISTYFLYGFSIDKKYEIDNAFIYSSHYYVPYILSYSLVAYSIFEGISTSDNLNASRFNRTSSKALESLLLTQISTDIIKLSAGRKRPINANSPNHWGYYGNKSFVSGHVSSTTAIVMPYILEYRKDYPAIYLLALLPVHQMIGRIKAQAHWTSDVIAGALLGGLIASYRFNQDKNLLFYFTPDKKYIGFKHSFQ